MPPRDRRPRIRAARLTTRMSRSWDTQPQALLSLAIVARATIHSEVISPPPMPRVTSRSRSAISEGSIPSTSWPSTPTANRSSAPSRSSGSILPLPGRSSSRAGREPFRTPAPAFSGPGPGARGEGDRSRGERVGRGPLQGGRRSQRHEESQLCLVVVDDRPQVVDACLGEQIQAIRQFDRPAHGASEPIEVFAETRLGRGELMSGGIHPPLCGDHESPSRRPPRGGCY